MIRDIAEQIRRRLMRLNVTLIHALSGDRPVPLPYWRSRRRTMSAIFRTPDVLTFPLRESVTIARNVRAPELRDLLLTESPTNWALDPQTIDFLWRRLAADRPRAVIECGAGSSTLIFAKHASLTGAETPFVISLEQDEEYAHAVEEKLARHGLERFAAIVPARLDERSRYVIDPARIGHLLAGRAADWLLIDGPSGPEGCRTHTLPLLAPLCAQGARWFLDDAFRDSEIDTLSAWSKLPGVRVEGIDPLGKGLATGVIVDPAKVTPL